MKLYILLTTPSTDAGPFNIYSNVDGFLSPFALNISKTTLLEGYVTTAPDETTTIRIVSSGNCSSVYNFQISGNYSELITCSETASSKSSEFNNDYYSTKVVTFSEDLLEVSLDFQTNLIPERCIVTWENDAVIDTGYIGHEAYDVIGSRDRTFVFNESLTGKVDPITGNTYPDLTTYPDDGYPRVSQSYTTLSFVKSSTTSNSATVDIYSPCRNVPYERHEDFIRLNNDVQGTSPIIFSDAISSYIKVRNEKLDVIDLDGNVTFSRSDLNPSTTYGIIIWDGYLYIPRYQDNVNSITRIPISNLSAVEETYASYSGGFASVNVYNNQLYVSTGTNNAIGTIDPVTKDFNTVVSGVITVPLRFDFDPSGNIYIPAMNGSYGDIYKFDGVSTTLLYKSPRRSFPTGVYYRNGEFYVTLSGFNPVIKFYDDTFSSFTVSSIIMGAVCYGLTFTPTSQFIYVDNASIYESTDEFWNCTLNCETLISCNQEITSSNSEGFYPSVEKVLLQENTGTVELVTQTHIMPERFIVKIDNNVVLDTGYIVDQIAYSQSYDFGARFRSEFNSSLNGKVDPITGNTYPDLTTYSDDGYPRVNLSSEVTKTFLKNSTDAVASIVEVYSPYSIVSNTQRYSDFEIFSDLSSISNNSLTAIIYDGSSKFYCVNSPGKLYSVDLNGNASYVRDLLINPSSISVYIRFLTIHDGYIYFPRHNEDLYSITRLPLNNIEEAEEEIFISYSEGFSDVQFYNNQMYASTDNNNAIVIIDMVTKNITTVVSGLPGRPSGFTFNELGDIYMALGTRVIYKFDGVAPSLVYTFPFTASINSVKYVNGEFFVSMSLGMVFIKFTDSTFTNYVRVAPGVKTLNTYSFAFHPDGKLIFAFMVDEGSSELAVLFKSTDNFWDFKLTCPE